MSVLEIVLMLVLGGVGLLVACALALVLFTVWFDSHSTSLLYELPWGTWLTIDDVVNMGHSQWFVSLSLPRLQRGRHLEYRSIGEEGDVYIELLGDAAFQHWTINLFEFKLVRRPRRKKRFDWGVLIPSKVRPAYT